jgi:hypothetical protein
MGWKEIASETEGRKMSSDMTNADKPAPADINMSSISPGSFLFSREVGSSLLPENLYSFEQLISNIFR